MLNVVRPRLGKFDVWELDPDTRFAQESIKQNDFLEYFEVTESDWKIIDERNLIVLTSSKEVAFAVIFDPPDFDKHDEEITSTMVTASKYVRNQGSRTSVDVEGDTYCFGWRGGYQKGESFGRYVFRDGIHGNLVKEEECSKKIHRLARYLETTVLKSGLVSILLDRAALIDDHSGFPTLDGTLSCPSIMITHNYRAKPHIDSEESYTIGLWCLSHQTDCESAATSSCAPSNWYFFLSDFKTAIRLRHGTLIIWQAARWTHGTIRGKEKMFHQNQHIDSKGCRMKEMSAVALLSKQFVNRIDSVNKKK